MPPTATLTPMLSAAYANLSFLIAGGNGPITVGCVVRHANGSSDSNSFVVPDWVGKSPVAFFANGRVSVTSKTVTSVNANNPRLYAADVLINAEIDKRPRAWAKPSDHVPVVVELDLEAVAARQAPTVALTGQLL